MLTDKIEVTLNTGNPFEDAASVKFNNREFTLSYVGRYYDSDWQCDLPIYVWTYKNGFVTNERLCKLLYMACDRQCAIDGL